MKDKIIIAIDGIDGTGKSTLVEKIKEFFELRGLSAQGVHATYNKLWDIEHYHRLLVEDNIHDCDVLILDRWIASEYAYGTAFRDGPSYDTIKLLTEFEEKYTIVHIHADNNLSVENFEKLKESREEMFDDSQKMKLAKQSFHDFYYCISEKSKVESFDYNKCDEYWFHSLFPEHAKIKPSNQPLSLAITYVENENKFVLFIGNKRNYDWSIVSEHNADGFLKNSSPALILENFQKEWFSGEEQSVELDEYIYEYIYFDVNVLCRYDGTKKEWETQDDTVRHLSLEQIFKIGE